MGYRLYAKLCRPKWLLRSKTNLCRPIPNSYTKEVILKTMSLPKSFTKVTTFSKWLALSMFIIIPILSFYYGIYYHQKTNTSLPFQKPTPTQEMTFSTKLTPVIDAAKENLATKLSINVSTIHVASATETTWNDGSLGCPKPGMMYTQSLVEGYTIVLSDGKNEYEYHSRTTGEPFLCENPR